MGVGVSVWDGSLVGSDVADELASSDAVGATVADCAGVIVGALSEMSPVVGVAIGAASESSLARVEVGMLVSIWATRVAISISDMVGLMTRLSPLLVSPASAGTSPPELIPGN